MRFLFFLFLFVGLGHYGLMAQDVAGTVFIDIPANGSLPNTYGQKDANELGKSGVTVTVVDNNQAVTTVVTDANGGWSVSNPTFPVRVEFSWSEAWLAESPFGASNNASVRIVAASSTNIDLGLSSPNDYFSSLTPDYVSHVRVAGSSINNEMSSLETVHYDDTGLSSAFAQYDGTQGTGPLASTDAKVKEIGSIWGKAYQVTQKRMFLTSVLWRHVGFAAGKGPSDIFVMDYSNGSPAAMLGSVDLQGVMPNNGGSAIDLGTICRGGGCENNAGNTGILADYELSADPTVPSVDLDAFAKTGKISFGGISYDAVTDKIWTINLMQKGIIEIDASGDFASLAGNVNQYLIESLPNVPACAGGALRPWALKTHNGKGYVGCLCDGATSQNTADMDAYVLSFDLDNPTAGFTTVITLPLNYDKNGDDWNPWSDIDQSTGSNWKHYAQPILSDIEFDEEENMYLAFIDRWGLQAGFHTYPPVSGASTTSEKAQTAGELFKMCYNAGAYELEGTGTCPVNYAVTSEFFNDKSGDNYPEGSSGALAAILGRKQLLVQMVDPHPEGDGGQPYWTTQGVNTLSTEDGSVVNWYSNINSSDNGYNGKGVGMGDVELLADPAPVEIGNFVWNDANNNGIQDPSEAGIGNVTVKLRNAANAVIATATTDANGFFIFSSDPLGASSANKLYNLPIFANKAYSLLISDAQGGTQQGALNTLALTQNDTGQGANANLNDNDATLSGNDAIININPSDLASIGVSNHSFDFGFGPPPLATFSIDAVTPSACDPATNYYSLSVTVTYSNAPAGEITITTDSGASQTFTPTSTNGSETFVLTDLVSNGVGAIDVTATYVNDGTVTATSVDAYDAPANCFCPPSRCLPTAMQKH